MTRQTNFSRTKEARHLPLLGTMLRAQKEAGKPVLAQALEMLSLRRGPGRLAPEEYLANRLYDDRLHMAGSKRRFVGCAAEEDIDRICNADPRWHGIVKDKIVFAAMMTSFGFPVPTILALHHARRRCFTGRELRTRADVQGYLRSLDRPVFGKPVRGRWSIGASSLTAYDAPSDSVITLGGQAFLVEALADQVMAFGNDGYLFEERLEPHPVIAEICGAAMSTVRVLTMTTAAGVEILAAAWKIVASGNIADNFWRRGNLLAAVDEMSGRITRAVSDVGPETKVHEVHPDTGRLLQGIVLPDWPAARTLCLDAATALAGLNLIGWDIALTRRGPVIVEANTLPAFSLHQIATGRGLLDDRFAAFIADCGRRRDA